MQITTRRTEIPIDAVQTAYNNALMSGRMAFAREIEQLWLSRLAKQKIAPRRTGKGMHPHSPDDALICATITPIQI